MLLFAVSMALGAEPGEQIELSPTPGQPVLVNFWASWCAPCRAELPLLDALNDEVESEGLSVVAVNLDSQRRPAEGVMRHLGLDLPVIYGDDDLAEAFAPAALPATYLLDASGRIVEVKMGVLDEAEVERLGQALLDLAETH